MFASLKKLTLMLAAVSALASCHEKDPLLIGVPPNQRKTTGVQVFTPMVDILFVIDDSGSMAAYQQDLADNVDLFLSGFNKNRAINYHIGVISTGEKAVQGGGRPGMGKGAGGGHLSGGIKYIDNHTPNGLALLKENMLMGINGTGYERMFSPTYLALTEPNLSGWNSGFYRKNAALAIVMITDAEEQSNFDDTFSPRSSSDPLYFSPQSFYDFLLGLKGHDVRKVLTYGAIIPEPNSLNCVTDDPNMTHDRITEFFRLSKGITYTLCEPNWGKKLANVGEDLVDKVGKRIRMDRRPQQNSIEVYYGTQQIPADQANGWTYDPNDNSIVLGDGLILDPNQPANTQIEIDFEPM